MAARAARRGGTASGERQGIRLSVSLLPTPVRRLFGESTGVTWGVIFIMLMAGMLLVRPMAMSLLSYHRTAGLLAERRAEVSELEAHHRQMTEQLAYYRTADYIRETARRYGMVMPGEHSYVVRELVHPQSAGRYATNRLRNATVDNPATWH